MPKHMVNGDSYIRVEPTGPKYMWSGDLDDIRKGILRHVDGVTKDDVHIITERLPVCSYCGVKWTEDSIVYNGGCCDKDEVNSPDRFTRI